MWSASRKIYCGTLVPGAFISAVPSNKENLFWQIVNWVLSEWNSHWHFKVYVCVFVFVLVFVFILYLLCLAWYYLIPRQDLPPQTARLNCPAALFTTCVHISSAALVVFVFVIVFVLVWSCLIPLDPQTRPPTSDCSSKLSGSSFYDVCSPILRCISCICICNCVCISLVLLDTTWSQDWTSHLKLFV